MDIKTAYLDGAGNMDSRYWGEQIQSVTARSSCTCGPDIGNDIERQLPVGYSRGPGHLSEDRSRRGDRGATLASRSLKTR
jgi:hypothetical protein